MADFKLNYSTEKNKGARDFHASNAMYKGMVGALGSGKTATGCVEGLTLSLEYPGNVGLIARKSLPELKTTTLKRFFEYLPDPIIVNWNKTERELILRSNNGPNSTVYFGPLDELDRYKSLELGWFFIDEASETTEDMWLTLCGRLRLKDVRLCGMLATNPTSRNHWIYKRFVVDQPKGYELFRSKTLDNIEHLPPGYIDQLRANYPDDWQRRFVDGEWGVIQGGDPCFPDFKQDFHVKALQPIKGLPMIRGWDFGRRRPCCVWAQFDEAGRFRIYRTLLGDNEDIYQFSTRVLRVSKQNYPEFEDWRDYCDIAGKQERDSGKSSIAVLRENGVRDIKYRYSNVDVRIVELRKMFREIIEQVPCVLVDPINTYLIEGFAGGYAVDDDGNPKKDSYFEHGMDAIGYIIVNVCLNSEKSLESDWAIEESKWSYNP